MKKILLLAAIPFLAATARAQADLSPKALLREAAELAAKTPTPPSAPRPSAPEPVVPNFRRVMELWSAAKAPSQDFLKGDWKLIVQVFEPAKCGFIGPDVYKEEGVRDAEGGVMGLRFSRVVQPGSTDGVFAMSVLSDGKVSDGPFRVGETEPQFSMWPSPGGEHDQRSSWWEDSCRTMPGSGTEIVCAEKFRMTNPQKFDSRSRECGSADYGVMEVYSKGTL